MLEEALYNRHNGAKTAVCVVEKGVGNISVSNLAGFSVTGGECQHNPGGVGIS